VLGRRPGAELLHFTTSAWTLGSRRSCSSICPVVRCSWNWIQGRSQLYPQWPGYASYWWGSCGPLFLPPIAGNLVVREGRLAPVVCNTSCSVLS
jgi:hypothetical protein